MSKAPVLDSLIAENRKIREQLAALSKQERELKLKKEELDLRLIQAMDAVGTDMARGKGFTAFITEDILPKIEDPDRFQLWVKKNNAFYLYYARIAAKAYREMLETRKGREIPGLEHSVVRKVNIRASH
jgi:hypothetical protein